MLFISAGPSRTAYKPNLGNLKSTSELFDPSNLMARLQNMPAVEETLWEQWDEMLKNLQSSVEPGYINIDCRDSNRHHIQNALRVLSSVTRASELQPQTAGFDFEETIEAVKRQLGILHLRYGLSSLSDDVLGDILFYVTGKTVFGDNFQPGFDSLVDLSAVHIALALSHTCSRFRSLVFALKIIWTTLSDQASSVDMMKLCVERSGDIPLDMVINTYGFPRFGGPFEEIFKACLPSAYRWRTFTLGVIPSSNHLTFGALEAQGQWNKLRENALMIERLTKELDLPQLRYLDIGLTHIGLYSRDSSDPRFHPYLNWSMPNLTSAHFRNCIPMDRFKVSNHITNFSVLYSTHGAKMPLDFVKLAVFLSSCETLETVDVQLMYKTVPSNMPLSPISIPHVKRICFGFWWCHAQTCHDIFASFQFMDATFMELRLEHLYAGSDGRVILSDYEPLVSQAFSSHPQLTEFELCLEDTNAASAFPHPHIALRPNLEHFAAKCANWKTWSSSILPNSTRLPTLRSLEMKLGQIGEWKSVLDWVKQLIGRLKEQDGLDKFEMLTISTTVPGSATATHELEGDIYDLIPARKIRFVTRSSEPKYPIWI